MQKKLFILLMAAGLAFVANSQTKDEAAAVQMVNNAHSQFVSNIKNGLENNDKKAKVNWDKASSKETNQFFVEESKKSSLGLSKKNGAKAVYTAMLNKTYHSDVTNSSNYGANKLYDGEKNKKGAFENTDKYTCYSTKCQIKVGTQKTETKKGTVTSSSSLARNEITLYWRVEFSKSKKDAGTPKKVTLMNIKVVKLNFITSEKTSTANKVKEEIKNWYKNLNNNSDLSTTLKKTAVKTIDVNSIDLSKISVNLNDNDPKQNIKVKGEEFKVFMQNPWDAVKGRESHYTDPISAYWKITPVFNVDVDIVNNTAEIKNIDLSNTTFVPPASDTEKDRLLYEATQVANNFKNKFEEFASDTIDKKTKKELAKELEGMFVDKKSEIQFTLLDKKGEENQKHVDKPTCPQKYLRSMPAAKIDMDFGEAVFVDGGTTEVMIPFTQTYKQDYQKKHKGKKYADKTQKAIYLKYVEQDNEQGRWLIDKITAIKGSTIIINEEE